MANRPIGPREPDYKIAATIKKDEYFREGIRCDVYLPEKVTGPIFLYLYPTLEQMSDLPRFFDFSVSGKIKDVAGEVIGSVYADRVFSETSRPKIWEKAITGWEVLAEPEDFTVTHILNKPKRASGTIRGVFWFTPCILLSPQKVIMRYPSGKVLVKTLHKLAFDLANGTSLVFDKHFHRVKNEEGDEVVFQELVAEFKFSTKRTRMQETISVLDDFLLLASCAARQKCLCIGYDSFESGAWNRFYRKNLVLPKDSNVDVSYADTLIRGYEFEEFISVAYENYFGIEDKVLYYRRREIRPE